MKTVVRTQVAVTFDVDVPVQRTSMPTGGSKEDKVRRRARGLIEKALIAWRGSEPLGRDEGTVVDGLVTKTTVMEELD